MEIVSTDELLIEAGKSGELIAAFQALQETSVDDGPKYTTKTCRELARAISCRSYGRAMLELAYLFVVAAGCDRRGGRFEAFFWDSGAARPNRFRAFVQDSEPLKPGLQIESDGVAIGEGPDRFVISFGRMPFLSAFVEFLMTTIGYAEIDALTEPLRGEVPPRAVVAEAANALSRALYDYLRDQLPSAHHQRKNYHFLEFINARTEGRTGPHAVDDAAILEFWLDTSLDGGDGSEGSDFKTYQSVFEAAIQLRRVMEHALDQYRLGGARSIGGDFEAGEIDPDVIDAAVEVLETAIDPLMELGQAPLDAIKFLNGRESETAAEIALGPGVAIAVSRSVLRNAVFGRVQNRITNALRHDRLSDGLLEESAETDYGARLADYDALADRLERTLLAVLHVLATARRGEAIELAMALRPDLDLSGLVEAEADEPEWADDNVVSITAVRAADRFFDHAGARAGTDQPLGMLMAEARKAFRGNSRQGFSEEDLESPEMIDGFAAGVSVLLALRREVTEFADDCAAQDWAPDFAEDRDVFTRQFRILYGGENDH